MLDGAWRKFLWPPLVAAVVGAVAIRADHPIALTVAMIAIGGLAALAGIQMMLLAGDAVMEPALPPGGVPRVVSGICMWLGLWTAQLVLSALATGLFAQLLRLV